MRDIWDIVVHLAHDFLSVGFKEVWRLPRRPMEGVPLLHAASPHRKDCGGLLHDEGFHFFYQRHALEWERGSSPHRAVRRAETDRVSGRRDVLQILDRHVVQADEISGAAGIRQPA